MNISFFLSFLAADEKNLVEEVFRNATDCLSDDDKKLPQVRVMNVVMMFYERL